MRVGDRQRGQHAATAHDETGVGFLLDARREERVRLAGGPDAAVRLRGYQRMGQAEIRLAQLLVQAHGVRTEARVAGREVLRRAAYALSARFR